MFHSLIYCVHHDVNEETTQGHSNHTTKYYFFMMKSLLQWRLITIAQQQGQGQLKSFQTQCIPLENTKPKGTGFYVISWQAKFSFLNWLVKEWAAVDFPPIQICPVNWYKTLCKQIQLFWGTFIGPVVQVFTRCKHSSSFLPVGRHQGRDEVKVLNCPLLHLMK